jgi:plasmid stabilization system protein ParE
VEQGVPEVGSRLVKEVFQHAQALADHPDMAQVAPEFDQAFLRELIHPPFRIVYRPDLQRVRIGRVWRCERLLRFPFSGAEGL